MHTHRSGVFTAANFTGDLRGRTAQQFLQAAADGRLWLNVHSRPHPISAIAGQLQPLDGSRTVEPAAPASAPAPAGPAAAASPPPSRPPPASRPALAPSRAPAPNTAPAPAPGPAPGAATRLRLPPSNLLPDSVWEAQLTGGGGALPPSRLRVEYRGDYAG